MVRRGPEPESSNYAVRDPAVKLLEVVADGSASSRGGMFRTVDGRGLSAAHLRGMDDSLRSSAASRAEHGGLGTGARRCRPPLSYAARSDGSNLGGGGTRGG